jgi:WD40 repeat protein
MPGGQELVAGDQRVSVDGSRVRPFRPGWREVSDHLVGGPGVQVSLRGTRLVFSTPESLLRLFRVDLAGAREREPQAFLASTRGETHAAFSPDGRRVAFTSRRSGDGLVWVCNVDGSGCLELPHPSESTGWASSPAWSPDGRRLAFDAGVGDQFHVFVAAPGGGPLRPLTSSRTYDARPCYSPDGRWIYFTSTRSGDYQIWRMRADAPNADAEATQMTRQGGIEAEESPDGRYLYYAKRNRAGLWRLFLGEPGAREEKVLDIGGEGLWSLRLEGILVLIGGHGAPPAIGFFDFATRRVSELRALPGDWTFVQYGGAFAVSPDGQWVVVTVERVVESDLMLVEGFR